MGHGGYTQSRCSSVHLERGEINHTVQKDKSPGAVAPSKQEQDEGTEERRNLEKCNSRI